MVLNFSNMSSITGMGDYFIQINYLTNNLFTYLLLSLIFLSLLISLNSYKFKISFLVSLYITFFIAVLFMRMNLISFNLIIAFLICLIVSILVVIFDKSFVD